MMSVRICSTCHDCHYPPTGRRCQRLLGAMAEANPSLFQSDSQESNSKIISNDTIRSTVAQVEDPVKTSTQHSIQRDGDLLETLKNFLLGSNSSSNRQRLKE